MSHAGDAFPDRELARHLARYQEEFITLSDAASREELVARLARMLRAAFNTPDVTIAHGEAGAAPAVLHPAGDGFDPRLDATGTQGVSLDDAGRLAGTIAVAGDERFWLRVDARENGVAFNDVDAMLLSLFLQLLGSAWRYFDATERDRDHLFDLNNRVLQLHDLVDSGVEMLRLTDEDELFLYVLQRCVALTDSTRGRIEVEVDGAVRNTIAFPMEGPDLDPKLSAEIRRGSQILRLTISGKESRDEGAGYSGTDALLMDGLARQLQVTLENRDLQQDALEKQRYENELLVAAEIQQRLLPTSLPAIDGYQIAGINIPAYNVGGDFYDCIDLQDGRIALVMADVAGKGMPAALLVNSLHAAMRSGLRDPGPLTDLMVHLNRFIYSVSTSDKFITCFLCVLTPETGELDVVNAGHDPGIIVSEDGSLRHIPAGGVSLGMVNMNLPYDGQQLVLQRGESLLLFTDGIPEAMNLEDEAYGDDTFERFIVRNRLLNAENFLSTLVDDVLRHTGAAPRSDDITALMIKRL